MEVTKKIPLVGFHPSEEIQDAISVYAKLTGLSKSDIAKLALIKFFGIGGNNPSDDATKTFVGNCKQQ
jgi:hypothetical protein